MNNTTDIHNPGHNLTSTIILVLIVICLYGIGLFFHAKIIYISKREKGMTWKLDITNSFLLIIIGTYSLLLHIVTYMIQDLYTYTGTWFCYVSKAITYYGLLYTIGHSLIIALMKYTVIVHEESIRNFGKDKVKEIFFWLNFLHPFVWTALDFMLRPEFDGFIPINRCLGNIKNTSTQGNATSNSSNYLVFLCHLAEPLRQNSFEYTVYIFKQGICVLQFVATVLIAINFFEVLLYSKIFSFARR